MKRVFIVDDSILLCERLTYLLSELPDVSVIGQAHTSQDAVQAIDTLTPDVIILDMHLINGNGFDVLEHFKTKKGAKPKIIVLTNYAYEEYRKKSFESGAYAFLDKTTQFGQLPTLLAQLS